MSLLSWLLGRADHGDRAPIESPAEVATSGFAVALYDALRRRHENLVFSPFSVWAVLDMAGAGARGDTAAEFRQVLQAPPGSVASARRHRDARPWPAQSAGAAELVIANSLWVQQGAAILGSYLEAMSERGGAIFLADFLAAAETTRSRMNQWVEEETGQRIRDLIGPGLLDRLTRLVLVNAVYFKGRWEAPFDPERTFDEPFFLAGGGRVTAPLMYQKSTLWYARADGYQAVDLGYRHSALAMRLMVPDRKDGLGALEAGLRERTLDECTRSMRPCKVELFLPKFKIEQRVELTDALRALGLVQAFDATRADFSGIDGRTPPDPEALHLSAVIQKAFVEIDEAGTEAAAASAAAAVASAPRRSVPPPVPVVRADHPFLYAVRERRSGELLFLGRMMDPTR